MNIVVCTVQYSILSYYHVIMMMHLQFCKKTLISNYTLLFLRPSIPFFLGKISYTEIASMVMMIVRWPGPPYDSFQAVLNFVLGSLKRIF